MLFALYENIASIREVEKQKSGCVACLKEAQKTRRQEGRLFIKLKIENGKWKIVSFFFIFPPSGEGVRRTGEGFI